MEKQITITQISAKFIKDFDVVGKMDPYLTFKVGSTLQQTQVASNAGLQPRWQAIITLDTTQQNQIEITAYDKDLTENQYMGFAQLNLKTLNSAGTHNISVIGKDNKSVGDVFFKYQIKQSNIPSNKQTSNTVNTVKISQIQAKFTDNLGLAQPFLIFKLGKSQDQTEITQINNTDVRWVNIISLAYNDETQIQIAAYNKELTQKQLIGKVSVSLVLLSKSGNHTVQMNGLKNQSVGSLTFKYEKFEKPNPQPAANQQKIIQQTQPISIEQPKQVPLDQQKPKPQFSTQNQIEKDTKDFPVDKFAKPLSPNIKSPIIQKDSPSNNAKKPTQIQQTILSNEKISLINNITKSTVRLPNIDNTSKKYGDSIYDYQSSTTLQKSIFAYSVPKAPRFHSGPKYFGEPSYYVDSCFKPNSSKGVGFGFGSKRQFPEWLEKNMKENPAPGSYFEGPKLSINSPKGPTFGISHKFYEKVTIPKQQSPQKAKRSNQRLKPIVRTNLTVPKSS